MLIFVLSLLAIFEMTMGSPELVPSLIVVNDNIQQASSNYALKMDLNSAGTALADGQRESDANNSLVVAVDASGSTMKVNSAATGLGSGANHIGLLTHKAHSSAAESRQRLLQHLFNPIHKQQNSEFLPTHVRVKLIPIKIQDLNEKNEVLEITIRLQLSWSDNRLTWNPRDFANTTEMIIPGNVIWSPDVGILNSVSDIYHVVRDTRFEMKIEHIGRVWWHPTGIVKTYCKLHLRYFPFDRQKCKLVLESPTLDIRFMNLTLRSITDPVDTVMYIGGETWDLLDVTGYNVINRLSVKTTFTRVEFAIHIQRARIYHLLNVIFPAIFLSLVQVMFFLLPATHPQRVGSSTTTLLSVVVFHSIAASQLPKTSTDVPLLAVYIFIVTFISGLSVSTSILVAKLAVYADQKQTVPRWVRRVGRPLLLFMRRRRRDNKALTAADGSEKAVQHVVIQMSSGNNNTVTSQIADPEAVPLAITNTPMNKSDNDDDLALTTWNDVSYAIDSFLLIFATLTALLSPVILFIFIPWLVEQKL